MSVDPPPRGHVPSPLAAGAPHASDADALTLWERISFGSVHALLSGMLAVVGLAGLYRFGRCFGIVEWLINFKRRRRFTEALSRVVTLDRPPTPAERRRWSREHFMQTRCDKLFYLVFDRISTDHARELLTLTNAPSLDDALATGRGVYLAVSHHGALHTVALLMCLRGYKVVGVRDRREGALRRYVQRRLDEREPDFQRMRVLFADSYPREIFRCFQAGCLLASAMDVSRTRTPNQRTEEVTVFRERRAFVSGPLRIAHRCGATALQAFVVSEPRFRYRLEIGETLLDPAHEQDEDAAVTAAMRTYAAGVEQRVRAAPSLITRL